jgi:hypothetical protein
MIYIVLLSHSQSVKLATYRIARLLIFTVLIAVLLSPSPLASASATAIQQPRLKWFNKGCVNDIYCETGWYSSPAVADLDGDGSQEVIGASYSLFILDGTTGKLKPPATTAIDPLGGRAWPGVVVADLQGDGKLEIVTAHGDGYVNVFDHAGNLLWYKQPTPGNELRSLAAYDLEGDGKLEILVASTASKNQWWVYEPDGKLRAGQWPQLKPSSEGYSWGCYNQNIAAGDLDGDGRSEVFGPNDTHYLAMFDDDGQQALASSFFGLDQDGTQKTWSQVGVHVSQEVDLRGYANCGSEHRPNFANSAPIMADLDGNGTLEAVAIGNVYNCGTNPYTDLYEIPFIFNADRTRWHSGRFDWTVLPTPKPQSAPISEDYNVIETNENNPAAADLDGDGNLEIIYASYDGRVHAYWLDKTEHGNWPYRVYHPEEGFFRFASEPVIADLNADGLAEVIFASWTQKGSNKTGKLHILDALGNPIYEVSLPPSSGGEDWNGALAAPTLGNIDGDPDLEVVLNTANSGLVAYDLPGTASARILWGTGRGSYLRSGSPALGELRGSRMLVQRTIENGNQGLIYTVLLRNPGPRLPAASLSDRLPAELTMVGNPTASSGAISYNDGTIKWNGAILTSRPVTITFQAAIDPDLTSPALLTNQASITDGHGNSLTRQVNVFVNSLTVYLPVVR